MKVAGFDLPESSLYAARQHMVDYAQFSMTTIVNLIWIPQGMRLRGPQFTTLRKQAAAKLIDEMMQAGLVVRVENQNDIDLYRHVNADPRARRARLQRYAGAATSYRSGRML
jgi:hypothetical protein